ncbi:7120_t:CDS:2, partial [Ambispora gerdemannii]
MWKRRSGIKVALKSLRDSQTIQAEFFNEFKVLCRTAPDGEDFENFSLRHILRCYGIAQNPATKEYVMVMQYADQGDLHKCLVKTASNEKVFPGGIKPLKQIAVGLSVIHSTGLAHRDLHAGNVLQDGKNLYICDIGIKGLLSARSKMGSEDNILVPRNLLAEPDLPEPKIVPVRYSKVHPESVYASRFLRFIDPINSTSFGTDSRVGFEGNKSFIAHKIKEIKKYQREKAIESREWKDQDFR